MTHPQVIRVGAWLNPAEREAMASAAIRITSALKAATADAATIETEFVSNFGALGATHGPGLTVSSFAAEIEASRRDWPATQARLRLDYGSLTNASERQVFVCTVFRHTPRDLEERERSDLLLAIRRLNLLAVELSHETGLQIIDIDRDLADVGGVNIGADYRLIGADSAEAAGYAMASTILAMGLDEWVSPEAQDLAMAAVARADPRAKARERSLHIPNSLTTTPYRRRGQVVTGLAPGAQRASVVLEGVLSGRIRLAEAMGMIRRAVARRGVRESLALAGAGLRRFAGQAPGRAR